MKPFDITKPVQTVDGRPARIICTDVKGSDSPIWALIYFNDGTEGLACYKLPQPTETFLRGEYHDEKLTLVNVPEEVTAYLNVYSNVENHLSRAEADHIGQNCYRCEHDYGCHAEAHHKGG